MRRLTLLVLIAATPAMAEPLPPGLQSARLLPGWTTDSGSRIAALELVLEPGWKTYWRSPGDSGIPPSFDWTAARNLAGVTFHWPAPEVIDSGGERTLGYHDRLVLPFTVTPTDPARPVDLVANVDFGLCQNICVPAHLRLSAEPAADAPDPAIEAAIARAPTPLATQAACDIAPISDGMQVGVTLPQPADAAVLELADAPEIWVSSADIHGGKAVADFVPPSGAPFDLDPARVVVTLIGPDGAATEMRGCDPAE